MKAITVWLLVGVVAFALATQTSVGTSAEERRDLYQRQFENNDQVPQAIRADYSYRHLIYGIAGVAWFATGVVLIGRKMVALGDNKGDIVR